MSTNWMNAREAAEALEVSHATACRLLGRGGIPGAFKLGRVWRLRAVDFERWLRSQSSQDAEPGSGQARFEVVSDEQ